MALNLDSNIDLIDQNNNYMNEFVNLTTNFDSEKTIKDILNEWQQWSSLNLETAINKLNVPNQGDIIVSGIYLGHTFNIIKNMFPNRNVIGIDANDYGNPIKNVIYQDVRKLFANNNFNRPVAILFDEIGSWHFCTQSKSAVFEFASNNVISNGYYIDILGWNNGVSKSGIETFKKNLDPFKIIKHNFSKLYILQHK